MSKHYAAGRDGAGELTEAGRLYEDLKTAISIKSDSACRAAMDAIRAYRARTGARGPLQIYSGAGSSPVRTSRPSTPAPATRASSGGSSLLAFIESARRDIADLRRDAIRAGLSARKRPASSSNTRGASITDDGDILLYDEDAIDDLDFEVITTEEGQRQQLTRNFY